MNLDEVPRTFLIDADNDEIAKSYYGKGWRAVDTLPSTGNIEVLSVMGVDERFTEQGMSLVKTKTLNGGAE